MLASGFRVVPRGRAIDDSGSKTSPIVATFAFKSRTVFVENVIFELTTNFRDFNAMTPQLKSGEC
jgi:hypothetical protein